MSLQIKEIRSNQFLALCKEFCISYYTHQSPSAKFKKQLLIFFLMEKVIKFFAKMYI